MGRKTGSSPAEDSGTMQVEITEDRLSDGDPVTGQHYLLGKGDRVTVPSALGKVWCAYGWAKDMAGSHPTGVRIAGAREVVVQDATLGGN